MGFVLRRHMYWNTNAVRDNRCFSREGNAWGDISIGVRTVPTCLGKNLLG